MQGEVLYFDPERGIGFISGKDGNRYHFDRADLESRADTQKGERVEFLTAGNRAKNVVSLDARTVSPPESTAINRNGASGVPPTAQTVASPSPAEKQSLFGHFRTCITGRYADFRGRAQRREYWGFVLFFLLTIAFLTVAGAVIDAAVGNLDSEPVYMPVFAALAFVTMVVPSFAVTVRRIHDIGLSGWFILLGLIPSIGNLIILVFAMIPSQKHANKWGQVPAGAL